MRSFKDLREKTLTPAEKKKREEIAKAMERDNPGMDMRKKMAIATWQAKKVAEEAIEESITKMSSPRLKFHATKGVPHGSYTRKEVEDEHKRRMKTEPNYHAVKPSLNEEAELEEGLYHVEYGRGGRLTHQVVAKDAKDAHQKAMAHLKKKNPKLAHPDYADTFNKPAITHIKGNEPRADKYKTEATELDEISRDLARSYIRKATADNKERRSEVMKPFNSKDMDKNVSQYKKMKSREKGIETAGKKAYDIGGKAKVPARESVELDEVSDKKLDAYRQKAFADQPSGDDGSDKYRKRKFGRDLAFAKQTGRAKVLATKEETELDELKKSTLGSYIKKASTNQIGNTAKVLAGKNDPDTERARRRMGQRMSGIAKATDKLTREQAEDDMAASPDEASMAMRQLDFIEDAAEKLKDSIKSGKGFPEWMQNKLSKLHGQMESLYSSLGEIEDEDEMDMDEAVQSADKKPQKYMRPDGKVGVRMVATDKKVVKND